MRKITTKTRKPATRRVKITRGSDNVFADLGFAHPEEELAKAKLVILIDRRIEELGLTQTAAAERMGLPQPRVSRLLRGDTTGISTERLMTCLRMLGHDVEIRVTPGKKKTGDLHVLMLSA